MRLNMLELARAVREEFHIEIPGAVADHVPALKDFHAYLIHVLLERGEEVDIPRAWRRLLALSHGAPASGAARSV